MCDNDFSYNRILNIRNNNNNNNNNNKSNNISTSTDSRQILYQIMFNICVWSFSTTIDQLSAFFKNDFNYSAWI